MKRIENIRFNWEEDVAEIKVKEETETGSIITRRYPIKIDWRLLGIEGRILNIIENRDED